MRIGKVCSPHGSAWAVVCAWAGGGARTMKTPHWGHWPASRTRHQRTSVCAESSSHIVPGCQGALQSKHTESPQVGHMQRRMGPRRRRPCQSARRRPTAPLAAATAAMRGVSPTASESAGATMGSAAAPAQLATPATSLRREIGRSTTGGRHTVQQPGRAHQRVFGLRSARSTFRKWSKRVR